MRMAYASLLHNRLFVACLLLVSLAVVAGYTLTKRRHPDLFLDSRVYAVTFEPPAGWIEGPLASVDFLSVRHPKYDIVLKGVKTEIEFEHNTNPDLDTEGMAEFHMAVFRDNLKKLGRHWTVERLGDLRAKNETFSRMRREDGRQAVYSAFVSRGNTSVQFNLSATGGNVAHLESVLPEFDRFLDSVRLSPRAFTPQAEE